MISEYVINSAHVTWMNWLVRAFQSRKPIKVHDYTRSIYGVDYFFEVVNQDRQKGYMTAQKKGVEVGDRIVLIEKGIVVKYRVQELNYYASPSDMWIALLVKVDR